VNIIWSPLYTAFLGTLHLINGHAFWVLMVSRFIIVGVVTLCVLAILRKLLPKWVAVLIAVWWAILPITFDTVYAVHLFAAMLVFINFVLIAYFPNRMGRVLTIAGFIVITILMRNEYSLSTGFWIVSCLGYEIYLYITDKENQPALGRVLLMYSVPVVVALGISGFFYMRSYIQFPELSDRMEPKHTLNVCQIYAYNRQQMGDDWRGSPWTGCADIMQRDFGATEISLTEAFALNPNAMLEHFWWNTRMIPDGWQLALFSSYSGDANPDYFPQSQSDYAWILLAFVGLVVMVGVVRFFADWRGNWQRYFQENFLVWLLMLATVGVALIVVVIQRPRPSYTFNMTLFIMLLFGLSVALLTRDTIVASIGRVLAPLIAMLMLLVYPSHYDADYFNRGTYTGQRTLDVYHILHPYIQDDDIEEQIVVPTTVSANVFSYLQGLTPRFQRYPSFMADKPDAMSDAAYFEREAIEMVLLGGNLSPDEISAVSESLVGAGWQEVTDDSGWLLLINPAYSAALEAPNG